MKITLLIIALFGALSTTAQLRFEQTTLQMGDISEDDTPREYTYKYSNPTDKPIVILAVETSCGCANPIYSQQPIKPGEQGAVVVKFHPDGHPGAQDRKFNVRTSQSSKPTILTLYGQVKPSSDKFHQYPHRIGDLRLKQNSVRLGVVPTTKAKMVRIQVANGGKRALRLSIVGAPTWLKFSTRPSVIAPDSVGDLLFVCDPKGLPQGKIEAEVMLEGLAVAPSQRLIKISGTIGQTDRRGVEPRGVRH